MNFGLHPRRRASHLSLWLALSCSSFTVPSADWPQFLGPNRNGAASSGDIAPSWPKDGPKILWQKKIGQGFSGPVVSSGKIILFHRLGDEEIVDCFEAKTGQPVWSFKYPTSYQDDFGFDEGPRATPAIANGQVFTFGAEGMLHCLDFVTGRKIWSAPAAAQFRAPKGFFGMACSPIVEDGLVLLNIGGQDGAGIVALKTANGALAWKAASHEASYSSPVAATFNAQRRILFFTREGLVGLNPKNGAESFSHPWRARMHASVNAAAPLVSANSIFLSSSYGVGAVLLQVTGDKLNQTWASDEALSSHYATPVLHQQHLYGFHGRQEYRPSFRCIELNTGRVRWSRDDFGAGTVTLAGNQLLILLDDGRLIQTEASPASFQPSNQAQILPTGVRAHPALSEGLFYARGKDKLACFDLRNP